MRTRALNFFKKINLVRFAIVSVPMIFSIYILICSGWLAQFFLDKYGFNNCYECSLKPEYIKNFFWTKDSFEFLFPCILIYGVMLFFKKRMYNYLLMVGAIWGGLIAFDMYVSLVLQTLTIGSMITNILYNLIGAITLGFYIVLMNSLINHLMNVQSIPLILSLIMPLVISISLSIIICTFIYLIYAKEPLQVEMTLSDSTAFAYSSSEKDDGFGFLNRIKTESPTYITTYKGSDFTFSDAQEMSDAYVFLVSECIVDPRNINFNTLQNKESIANVKSFRLSYPYLTEGFVVGEKVTVNSKGSKQLEFKKEEKQYTIRSLITKKDADSEGKIYFSSWNHPFSMAINFFPLDKKGVNDVSVVDFSVNNLPYKIKVKIAPPSINKTKKTECKYTQVTADAKNYDLEGQSGVGIVIYIKPSEIASYKSQQYIEIKSSYATLQKRYSKKEAVYSDISNGVLTGFNGNGVDKLKVGDKEMNINDETRVILSGENLVAFISNNQTIKIVGMADVVAINDIAINLRKLTVIKDKISSFGSSFMDVIKWIFSIGFISLACRLAFMFFRNGKNENIFLK
ncbi:hypothetical protein K3G69_04530 [Phytobacter diazotrophicus]|uniref:hypothetical protein n=1 Tax=Phytobacter diazotrophicus TaxID=395631 RepID=UPI001C9A282F|nr:hypothetical protein [Phytobacter diazotrophicus]MBY6255767.1 hypothetical protein [Phytobacter diazotrophicus]